LAEVVGAESGQRIIEVARDDDSCRVVMVNGQRQASESLASHDPSFVVAGGGAYCKDAPGAGVHIRDAGHFALDEQADEVIHLTEVFMQKRRGQ